MFLSLVLVALLAQAPISVVFRDADLRDFFAMMAQTANVNIVLHPAVQGRITLEVHDVSWGVLLDVVMKNYGLTKETQGNVIRIVPISVIEQEYKQQTALEEARRNALPLETRTIILNYAKATQIAPIVSKFLSPRGFVVVDPSRNALIITDVAP